MVTAAPNPNLVAFVGDLPGKLAAFEHTAARALNRGCTTIVQVGDLWIYDAPKELPKLQRVLRRFCPNGIELSDIDYRFIDGNHENFDVLDPDATSPMPMSDNVTYLPRGTLARLAGAEILFFGGASSIDIAHRTEGKTWWPAENITTEQVERVTAAPSEPVDFLVTHETNTWVFDTLCAHGGHARDKLGDPAGETNRAHLDSIAEHTRPRVQIHGHHHTRHTAPPRPGRPPRLRRLPVVGESHRLEGHLRHHRRVLDDPCRPAGHRRRRTPHCHRPTIGAGGEFIADNS